MTSISFITPELGRIDSAEMNALTIYRFNEKKPLSGIGALVDWRLYGHISRLVIEGFLSGEESESLLMPLGRHLDPECLLIFGLGSEDRFSKDVFTSSMKKLFWTLKSLEQSRVAVSLPGRTGNICKPTDAMEWFLESFEQFGDGEEVRIIEPLVSQEVMSPALERWRLKQLVP